MVQMEHDFWGDSLAKAQEEERSVRNIIRASRSHKSASEEISIWFGTEWRVFDESICC